MQTVNIKTLKPVHTRCPKCNGRITIEADAFGAFENCITCGYTYDLPDPHPTFKVPSENLKE